MRRCPVTASGSRWSRIRWTCTADGWRSMLRRSEGRASRCRCQDGRLLLDLELDALSQGKLAAPVHRVGLTAHVRLPGVRARLAASAGILLSAERTASVRPGRAEVDVGDAAVAAGRR